MMHQSASLSKLCLYAIVVLSHSGESLVPVREPSALVTASYD